MKKNKIIHLIISIFICQFAGLIGSFFTSPNIPTWYASISKPAFTPSSWIFAPAWITLYLLMGVSLYIIWEKGLKKNKFAVSVFGLQLALNSIWSILFFGLQNPFIAFIEIIVLWFAILATIILFYKIDRRAAYLLIPYILWVSFASLLNYSIWILNI